MVSIMGSMRAENVLLGKRIEAARLQRGWNKADLARKAGVAPSYITRIEQGKFDRPSIDQIRSIADALRVSVADLTDPAPAPVSTEERVAVTAMFRPDEAQLVAEILSDLAQRSEGDRKQILNGLRLMFPGRPNAT